MRKNHSPKQIIGDRRVVVITRRKVREGTFLIANFKPRTIKAALEDEDWINSMN